MSCLLGDLLALHIVCISTRRVKCHIYLVASWLYILFALVLMGSNVMTTWWPLETWGYILFALLSMEVKCRIVWWTVDSVCISGAGTAYPAGLYVCLVDHCLSFCTFYFGHCVVCYSSIYGFWLSVWYLQILLAVGRINRIYFILVHKYTYLSYLILICWKNYQKG